MCFLKDADDLGLGESRLASCCWVSLFFRGEPYTSSGTHSGGKTDLSTAACLPKAFLYTVQLGGHHDSTSSNREQTVALALVAFCQPGQNQVLLTGRAGRGVSVPPIVVIGNRKLRVKLTDRCNMSCPFCHAEGSPAASDVSLGDLSFTTSLRTLRKYCDTVHLTGGEPTLHRDLPRILHFLKESGYKIAITTNGLFCLEAFLPCLTDLDYVNVSLHSLSPDYLSRFHGSMRHVATEALRTIIINIRHLHGAIPTRINTVVSGDSEGQNLSDLLSFSDELRIPLKLVPDWRSYEQSRRVIMSLLAERKYELVRTIRLLPGSNVRRIYSNGNGMDIEFKDLESYRPQFLCHSCAVEEDCLESFAFVRIEHNPARFRLCIMRDAVGLPEFLSLLDRHHGEVFA